MQLAHAAGAIVYGTSRTADKLEHLRELKLGLDEGLPVGDTPAKIAEAVQQWTNGTGVDVILDLVGGVYFPANLEALALRGRLDCVGTTAGPKSEINIGLLMRKRATIIGTVLRARSIEEKAEATRRFATNVLPLVSRGQSVRYRVCLHAGRNPRWRTSISNPTAPSGRSSSRLSNLLSGVA